MSDYYDGYLEGVAQASREVAALRAQLEAMIESIADLKSITMPPPSIQYRMPTAKTNPMTEEQLDNIVCLERVSFDAVIVPASIEEIYKWGFRDAEKYHGIGGKDE